MGPQEALTTAIRQAMMEDSLLAERPIAGDELAAEDELPGAEVIFHSNIPETMMDRSEAFREVRFSVEWLADGKGGFSAASQTDEANEATRKQLYETIDGVDARDRINAYLEPLGYSVDHTLEVGHIPKHKRQFGRDKTAVRWCVGYFYKVNLGRN